MSKQSMNVYLSGLRKSLALSHAQARAQREELVNSPLGDSNGS